MKTAISLLALAALTLLWGACGDNKQRPDAAPRPDVRTADAQCSDCPPAPVLGTTQLDRMGRPAINTALNHTFDSSAASVKDAYNADANKASWETTYKMTFRESLGVFDALDGFVCGNGICETGETDVTCAADCTITTGTGTGCGNQPLYATPTSATSYEQLASVLARDALVLDTSRGNCTRYLAIEFGVIQAQAHTSCGGRTPQYDVIDVTYSALAQGVAGFSSDSSFTPTFNCDSAGMHCGDDVAPHDDYLSAFPYLGEPH